MFIPSLWLIRENTSEAESKSTTYYERNLSPQGIDPFNSNSLLDPSRSRSPKCSGEHGERYVR